MSCRSRDFGRFPRFSSPVNATLGFVSHPLPPHSSVISHGHVGEDRVFEDGGHGDGVALIAGAGRHTKEPILRVDRSQLTLVIRSEPGNVVTHHRHLEPLNLGTHHGQVGLAAGGGEGGSDVLLVSRRCFDT